MRTLNGTLGVGSLDVRILDQVFTTYWPQFELKFKEALSKTDSVGPAKPRPKEDMLGEILENTRILSSRIRKLEYETGRARSRADEPSPSLSTGSIHRRIREMLVTGVPDDVIWQRIIGRYGIPSEAARQIIDKAMSEFNRSPIRDVDPSPVNIIDPDDMPS